MGASAGLFFGFGGILPVFQFTLQFAIIGREGELTLQFTKAGALATSATRRIS